MMTEEVVVVRSLDELNQLIVDRLVLTQFAKMPLGWKPPSVGTWQYFKGIDQGHDVCSAREVKNYAGDMAAAWEVVAVIKMMLFSQRQKFIQYLSQLVSDRVIGVDRIATISATDLIWHVDPRSICLAALMVKGIEVDLQLETKE